MSDGELHCSSSGSSRRRMLSMWTLYLTSFIGATGYSIIMSSGYPYLQQLNSESTTKFYGLVVGAFSLGQLVGSPILGLLSNNIGYMLPFQFCLVMMCVGHTTYGYLDAFSADSAPYVMVAARFVIGIGSGNIAIVRSFASVTTTMEERTAVLTYISAAQAFGFVTGPLLQTVFVPIGDKGVTIDYLKLTISMYTAPAFFSAMLSLFNLIMFWVFFTDATTAASRGIARRRPRPIIIHDYTINPRNSYSLPATDSSTAEEDTRMMARSVTFRSGGHDLLVNERRDRDAPDFDGGDVQSDDQMRIEEDDRGHLVAATRDRDRDNLALVLCIYLWVVSLTTFSFYETLVTPILEVMYAWTPEKATLIASIIFALTSLVTVLAMAVVKIITSQFGCKERHVLVGALVLLGISFITVLPYSPEHPEVYYEPANASTTKDPDKIKGCDSTRYDWCDRVHQIYLWQFVLSAVINCMGYAGAVVLVATLFSKVVGPFPQGFLQGILTAAGSFARALGPLMVTQLFDRFGPLAAYLSQVVSVAIAIVVLVVFNRRLIQHILTREFGVSY